MKTKVIHSQTKAAWNIVGTMPNDTYKLVRVPYYINGRVAIDDPINQEERKRAFKLAESISKFLNTAENAPADLSECIIPVEQLKRMFKESGIINATSEKES